MLNLIWNRWDWCFFCVAIARPILRTYRNVIECAGAILAVSVLLLIPTQAHAGDIEPRAYVNTPVGVNFLILAEVRKRYNLSCRVYPTPQGLKGAPTVEMLREWLRAPSPRSS